MTEPVPVTVRLAGQLGVRPAEVVAVRVTVPVKPPEGVTVTVELPEAPVLKSAGEVAVIAKSPPNVNMALVVWDAVPGEPLPVIVTVKVPTTGEVHDRLDVPVPFAVRGTLVAVNTLQVRPATVLLLSVTVPTKLNLLVRVMVEVAKEPAGAVADEAEMVKSPT